MSLTVNMDKNLIETNVRTAAKMTADEFFTALEKVLAETPDEDGNCLDVNQNSKFLAEAKADNYKSYLNNFLWSRLCELICSENAYAEDDELDTQIKQDYARVKVRHDDTIFEFKMIKDGLPAIIVYTCSFDTRPCIGVIYAENKDTLRAYVPLYANSFNRDIMYGFWEDDLADDEFIARENNLDPDDNDGGLFEELDLNVSSYINNVIFAVRQAINVV